MNNLDNLGTLIAESISEYAADVKRGIDYETEKVGKLTKDAVANNAPVRTGSYRKSISLKIEKQLLGNKKATIYARKPHYRLTHLLEHGHALQNGGRTRSFPHWKQAERKAIEDYTKGVVRVIESGGNHDI